MSQAEVPLKRVEELRKKSFELFNLSKDGLYSLMMKGLDPIVLFLDESSDHNHIQRALTSLDLERKLSMQFEKSNADPLREMTYGFIESVHLAFHYLSEQNVALRAQIDGRPQKSLVLKHTQTDMSSWDFTEEGMAIKMEELINGVETPNFIQQFPVEPKEEPIDATQTMAQDNQISGQDFVGQAMDLMEEGMLNDVDMVFGKEAEDMLEEGGEKNETVEHLAEPPKDFPHSVKVTKQGRKSTRSLIRPPKFTESDEGPAIKKPRSKSVKKIDNVKSSDKSERKSESSSKERRVSKMNDTDLECPDCDYTSRSVYAWQFHLRYHHSTTPTQAGLVLLCECGHESASCGHSQKCPIANFTVIRKGGGPIRRLDDRKCDRRVVTLHKRNKKAYSTPQCILCETHPSTPGGYAQHLQIHHKSTLITNGIYIICECGVEIRTPKAAIHSEGCDRSQFTLHKLNEK